MYKYPYGYCGMPCALCTRYHTDGQSRCPGCSQDGYYTDACKAHHCCKGKGIGHCGSCGDFPCARLGGMGDFRDLDTNGAKTRTCGLIAEKGFEEWYAEYARRAELLDVALARYNNGRMKRYLCELFIREDIETLRRIMDEAQSIDMALDAKARGTAFREIADRRV